jgi:hypothetical protein
MYWGRIAVFVGSVVLGFSVGATVTDIAPHAEQAGLGGLGAGLGLGLLLMPFVRD